MMAFALVMRALPYLLLFIYLARRLRVHLHMMQQNSYRPERYLRWLAPRRKQQMLKRDFLLLLPYCVTALIILPLGLASRHLFDDSVIGILYMDGTNAFALSTTAFRYLNGVVTFSLSTVAFICLSAVFLLLIITYKKPEQKKALVMTKRAKRLYAAALVLVLVLIALFAHIQFRLGCDYLLPLFVVLTCYFSCYLMWLAAKIMQPVENRINRGFLNDARRIVREMPALQRIAVTGSYGKTSCKMALGQILAEEFNTLVTPHSYNTPMGITLTIRTMLKPSHQILVTEMGAKQTGDIAELCDLVAPNIGVLTAIGPQHLETFKTIENVAETKFELIRALPATGLAVLNLDNSYIRERLGQAPCRVVSFGLTSQDADYRAENLRFSPQGMFFDLVTPSGARQAMQTQLLGRHNVYNIVAAAAVACELGMSLPHIARAVAKMPQVQYRLELQRTAGGVTVINDGFNSNPQGAAAALEVLAEMPPTGKKIIITPGMIELGERQYEENKKFALAATRCCDYIILVGKKHSLPLQDGLREAAYPSAQYYVAADLRDANVHLAGIVRSGDYVIYENDLPDTYNE